MMSIDSVINQIEYNREYKRENYLHIDLSDSVDLGDGDVFGYCLVLKYNANTGNVYLAHPVSFRGYKIYPTKNCGKIDLDEVPDDVISRYEGYNVERNRIRREKCRLFRESRFKLRNSRSSRKLIISSCHNNLNIIQSMLNV